MNESTKTARATSGIATTTSRRRSASVPVFRLKLVRDRMARVPARAVESPHAAALLIGALIGASDRETFVALFLSCNGIPVGATVIAIGSLTGLTLTPRETFKAAIMANAQAVVLGHNHPSGNATPSREDLSTTSMLVRAGKTVGIEVVDHIIVCPDGSFASMLELGLLAA